MFKNPHHYGIQKYAAKLCDPEIAVFSTGSRDQPKSEYIRYLRRLGCKQIYTTSPNRHGNISISSDGKRLTVKTQYQYTYNTNLNLNLYNPAGSFPPCLC